MPKNNTTQEPSKFRQMSVMYLDIVIRGLISFFFVGIGLYFLLSILFHIPFYFVLPIVFIVSILIAPFLSKIKLGHIIFDRYENFLNKSFNINS